MLTVGSRMKHEAKPIAGHLARWIGCLLLANFVIVCAIKIGYGIAGDIWWMSHVGLLLAAVGFLRRSALLICTALISVLALHSLWLVDYVVWLLTGHFVLGVTKYLDGAEFGVWVATAHHFYLAPLLLITLCHCRRCPRASFPVAVALFVSLSLISRSLLAPANNVNFAFRVDTGLDLALLDWVNRLPGSAYLVALNAAVAAGFLLPVYIGLRCLCAERRRHAQGL